MLSAKTVKLISSFLKIKEDELNTAIKDEKEVDVPIDEKLSVLSEAEITTMKSNSYKEGKVAGVEMEVDEIKKETGLQFQGKSLKGLIDAHGKKVLADAKIEPEKKVVELQEKVATLQTTVKDYETKIADKDREVTGIKINSELAKHIPANSSLPADKVIVLMKADGYSPVIKDGKTVFEKDGKVLTDKLGEALQAKDVVEGYVKDNNLIKAEGAAGGRGKGDEGGGKGKFSKLSEIKADFEANKKNVLGDEFKKAVEEAAKDPDFDMNA